MTVRPVFRVLAVVSVFCACGRNAPEGAAAGGRFTLTRSVPKQAARQLVSASATASWCADDSSLVVVAVTSRGDGGAAARLHWPLTSMDVFAVSRRLGTVGSATVAWRPIEDTVRTALVADSGQLRLEANGPGAVSGSITAWARVNDSTTARLDGTLSSVPVVSRCTGAQ